MHEEAAPQNRELSQSVSLPHSLEQRIPPANMTPPRAVPPFPLCETVKKGTSGTVGDTVSLQGK